MSIPTFSRATLRYRGVCCRRVSVRLSVRPTVASQSGPDLSVWIPWAGSLLEAPTHPQML